MMLIWIISPLVCNFYRFQLMEKVKFVTTTWQGIGLHDSHDKFMHQQVSTNEAIAIGSSCKKDPKFIKTINRRAIGLTGDTFDDEQLQAEIGTFIMAGYETTAHTLSFTIHSIASNKGSSTEHCSRAAKEWQLG